MGIAIFTIDMYNYYNNWNICFAFIKFIRNDF